MLGSRSRCGPPLPPNLHAFPPLARHERGSPPVAEAVARCVQAGVAVPELVTLEPFKAEIKRAGEEYLRSASGKRVPLDSLDKAVVGLYFGAEWCPGCKKFTPALAEAYNKIRAAGKQFEVVFVSLDRSAEMWRKYGEAVRGRGMGLARARRACVRVQEAALKGGYKGGMGG